QIYNAAVTKELWIYGLNDNDSFVVNGKGKDMIFTRIIGGPGNDIYDIQNGNRIKVYDHRSKENTILANHGANIKFTDVYNLNVYNFEKTLKRSISLTPGVSYNPDDAVVLGASATYIVNGFQRNPFSQQHRLDASF